MCSRAFCTVLPCGSSTAFFGVIIILAFMKNRPQMRRDVRQSLHGRQYFLKTAAYFTARLDVFPRSGTTHGVEAREAKIILNARFAIGFAIIGGLSLLYFFAPSVYSFYPRCLFHSL